MALSLTSMIDGSLPVELPGVTPDGVRGKSVADVERMPVLRGREQLPLAELFSIAGKTETGRLEFAGDLSHVHGIGTGMCMGELRIEGNVGDSLGAGLRGGLIFVSGNAGHGVGAGLPGATRGMTGGTIVVHGNTGDRVGTKMRRGLIAVGGSAGNLVGHNMLAGTIVVLGTCGEGAGAGMKRGTLCLLGNEPKRVPNFAHACTSRFAVLEMLWRELESLGLEVKQFAGKQFDLTSGDLLSLGRGEMFTPGVSYATLPDNGTTKVTKSTM